ncbi:metallophosphoesterase [soil metagenome]
MKIQIASDLHLEFLEDRFPNFRAVEPTDADVLVIAGDIHHGTSAIAAFADWPVPVIYVHGNHEAYNEQLDELIAKLRVAAAGSQVHFLEQDEYESHGVRFLGCCLWTDYQLGSNPNAAMEVAAKKMIDHRLIHAGDDFFMPRDALAIHEQSRAWLSGKLDQEFDGPTVVVTHHGPHPKSIHPRYAGDLLNAAFVTDLSSLLGKAKLWIHGHVHDNFDYSIAGTRVIANPRGYALNRLGATTVDEIEWENKGFDPRMVVQL